MALLRGVDAVDRAAGRSTRCWRARSRANWAPLARDQGMALVPWSPLKNGFLSGKYRRGAEVTDSARVAFVGGPSDDQYVVIDAVAAIADELATSSAAVALAWLRARQGTVVPIVGARRVEHLDTNLAALDVALSPDQLRGWTRCPRRRWTIRRRCTVRSARCFSSPAPLSTANRPLCTRRFCRAPCATRRSGQTVLRSKSGNLRCGG